MIIGSLFGGLGNQMFQYAAALSYSKKIDTDLYFYKTFNSYYHQNHTKFDINELFDLKLKYISKFELEKKIGLFKSNFYVNRLLYKFSIKNNKILHDKSLEDCLKKDDYLLFGYFQNPQFFNDYKNLIINKLSRPLHSENLNKYNIFKEISQKNSISIHIRGGDYLFEKNRLICNQKYYADAIQIVNKKIANPSFYIFSDDLNYAQEILSNLKEDFVFIDLNFSNALTMHLMSICNHNIISNSTFSWWAAFLNKNNNKMIISPKVWSKNSSSPFLSLKEWIKI